MSGFHQGHCAKGSATLGAFVEATPTGDEGEEGEEGKGKGKGGEEELVPFEGESDDGLVALPRNTGSRSPTGE